MDSSLFAFMDIERFVELAVANPVDIDAVRQVLSTCSAAQLLEIVNYEDVSDLSWFLLRLISVQCSNHRSLYL